MKDQNREVGRYCSGGRNVRACLYEHGGALPYADKAKWVGNLSGSWYDMGLTIGRSCGEMMASSTDYWWGQMCEKKGRQATEEAMEKYLEAIDALDPTQIDLLRGMADGAKDFLENAEYGRKENPNASSAFYRVVAASIFDVWLWGNPDAYRKDARVNNTAEGYINGDGCNSIAAKGKATLHGETISSQVRHTQQAGLCYQASMSYSGEGCHTVWTVGNAPSLNGLLLANDQGVSISHHFGGSSTEASMNCEGGPCYGSAFGVPWPNLLFYAAKTAGSAAEALDILRHGSARYRQKTGRKTVLRDGTWNWMVCDRDTLAVLEVSPDRCAVRYAGEFTGEAWTDPDYIACANHFLCPYSFDENDVRTDVPMTIYNNNTNSQARFWTLMWELKSFYGKLDVRAFQYIFSQTYLREEKTGEYIYTMPDEQGRMLPAGIVFGCAQGKLVNNGLSIGTNAAKIAVLDGGRTNCWFCLGNPKDWMGEWDQFHFGEAE
ncbi:MAG: hypothetical protein ACI3WR_05130 [Oscillospiraceae bacterium]